MPDLITDIIACPGLDYCALANARSIPVAQEISRSASPTPERQKRDRRAEDQDLRLHQCLRPPPCRPYRHSRRREEGRGIYQITLGGDATENAAIGEILGPGLAAEDVPDAIERIVLVYLAQRQTGESFIDNVRRIGLAPFKAAFQDSNREVSHAVA
jgi:sulfite reductase (NADPH) hemoprotein beta-component